MGLRKDIYFHNKLSSNVSNTKTEFQWRRKRSLGTTLEINESAQPKTHKEEKTPAVVYCKTEAQEINSTKGPYIFQKLRSDLKILAVGRAT
jgi:hypothetical protein